MELGIVHSASINWITAMPKKINFYEMSVVANANTLSIMEGQSKLSATNHFLCWLLI
jgi:hypothetical protein